MNGWCIYCEVKDGKRIYNPDKYFIREIRIEHICSEAAKLMTPQEELFRDFFNSAKVLIKDMDTLQLQAKREEWAKIAFEAKAYLSAVDDEQNERKKTARKKDGKPTGFERSLNIDETTSDAINVIKDRQKKLTGKEKMLAGLTALYIKGGMTKEEAEKTANTAMGAGTILNRLKETDKEAKDALTGRTTHSPSGSEGFVIKKSSEELSKAEPKEEKKSTMFNPFAKKAEEVK